MSSTTATAAAPVEFAALDLVEDEDRRDLGAGTGRLPEISTIDADLADRPRERHRDAREDPREDVRQHDPAERRSARSRRATAPPPPSRVSSSSSTGCTVRTTNGSVTNSSARKIAVRGEGDVDRRSATERAVEREQDEAGDDRRQRERQVDHRVDERLAAEVVADEHPGDRSSRGPRSMTRDERRDRRGSASAPRPPRAS